MAPQHIKDIRNGNQMLDPQVLSKESSRKSDDAKQPNSGLMGDYESISEHRAPKYRKSQMSNFSDIQ